jgi:hypothetical protein
LVLEEENDMAKPVVLGASLGLLAGVLIGTVGGSSMFEEVVAQMVFGLIGGMAIGFCYHILTRKKREDETFLPSQGAESQATGTSIAIWIVPVISLLAAIIKGFFIGANLGR